MVLFFYMVSVCFLIIMLVVKYECIQLQYEVWHVCTLRTYVG